MFKKLVLSSELIIYFNNIQKVTIKKKLSVFSEKQIKCFNNEVFIKFCHLLKHLMT